MTEVLLVSSGFVLGLAFFQCRLAFIFARKAQESHEKTKETAAANLTALRDAAAAIAESHNDLAKTQAEQGQTLERLMTEVAGRQIARR